MRTKSPVSESLLGEADELIIHSGTVLTFLKERGLPAGVSLVEEGVLGLAKSLEEKYKAEKRIS